MTETRWEDTQSGDEIDGPPQLLSWSAVVLQVSGSQDWNLVHHDPDYSQASGHDQIFFNTGWTAGTLSRLLTDWMGRLGWLCHLDFRMTGMNVRGDTVRARGRVRGKRIDEAGDHLVELDVWLDNDRRGVTTSGAAVVRLPSASLGS
jgi:acyl dehydratase